MQVFFTLQLEMIFWRCYIKRNRSFFALISNEMELKYIERCQAAYCSGRSKVFMVRRRENSSRGFFLRLFSGKFSFELEETDHDRRRSFDL